MRLRGRSSSALLFTACTLAGCSSADGVASATDDLVVGDVNWLEADAVQGLRSTRARAVGYLRMETGARCTAWLVSPSALVTNHHCIPFEGQARGASVNFEFYREGDRERGPWFDCSTFLATSAELDITLLRCAPREGQLPGDRYGFLELDEREPGASEAIYVVHQNCDHIRGPCAPTKKISPGRILEPRVDDFGRSALRHDADTLGGSSGAPILSAETHRVLGLHYGNRVELPGSAETGRGPHNHGTRAVELGPVVRAALGASSAPPPPQGSASGTAHSTCDVGGPLEPSADPCVAAVCREEPSCCQTSWGARCIAEMASTCLMTCEQ
jgi:hypothetical protein